MIVKAYSISKRFSFSAAHRLGHLDPDHKCFRPHGHNYEVVIELSADDLNGSGFIIDYAELDFVKDYIDTELDHRDLNYVFGSGVSTTAEHLARHFAYYVAARINEDIEVTAHVSETPKTWATYRKGSA